MPQIRKNTLQDAKSYGIIIWLITAQKKCSGIEVVITGLTRNQFEGNLTRVRIPPAAPRKEETPDGVSSFLFCCVPPMPQEGSCQQRRGVKERGGEDNEREVTLHLVARRDKALDEQVANEIARGDQREMAERFARFFPAAEEKGNTQRNKKRQ